MEFEFGLLIYCLVAFLICDRVQRVEWSLRALI